MHSEKDSNPHLAFDFGAESARAVLVRLQSDCIAMQEVGRFPNEPVEYGGSLHWDVPRLWLELRRILANLAGTRLASIGIDAWGVDYALLGENGELLQNPFHYRDRRTAGTTQELCKRVPKEEIYRTTGIQFMSINTLNQLFVAARDTPQLLRQASCLLTIPDLFNYWLTGNAKCEFTNATTTQLVNPRTRTWASELISRFGFPDHLWTEIVEPGTCLGSVREGIACSSPPGGTPVIAPASHDTGSSFAAISAIRGDAFLSSGTWSLVGAEVDAPVISEEALRLNFTNEGGVNGTTRLLKNVMGLWMLQACQKSWSRRGIACEHLSLLERASREEAFASLVDPDHESFLNPEDMPSAIATFCRRTQQPVPGSPAAYVRVILESLALKYRLVLAYLEKLTGQPVKRIRIVGGGSKNDLLNQLTANATGRIVLAGPAEATALGNAAIQIVAAGKVASLQKIREIIERSFPPRIFHPSGSGAWDLHAKRFEHYCEVVHV